MAISYGFFNSVNGDRLYNADDISNYFLKLISNGVFATPSNAMQVQESSGMTVSVSAGWGFINCKWINNSSAYNLTLDASDIALNRIDRIVLRLNADTAHRNIEIAVLKGSPAATPSAPALTRVAGGVWELSLAQIYIGANVSAITQANITDERPNTTLCGFVTGLIDQIDTTNLFAQFTAAFNEWFEELQQTLATRTMILRYTNTYTTITANTSVIPIGISEYTPGIDVLNVYINGLRLIPNVDYTAGGANVTLAQVLDVIGTPVEFEVLKSIDGTNAESVLTLVNEIVSELQKLDANNYYCNGVNDNVGLTNWLTTHPDAKRVNIIGDFGTVSTAYTLDGVDYSFVCQSVNGIVFDFSQCGQVTAWDSNFAYFGGCRVIGLNLVYDATDNAEDIAAITAENTTFDNCSVSGTFTPEYAVTAFDVDGCTLNGCTVSITATADVCGVSAAGSMLSGCDIAVRTSGATANAYGVNIVDVSRVIGCTLTAITAATGTGIGCGAYGGGIYQSCEISGFGALDGYGFYLASGQFLDASGCTFRGYTKDSVSGEGVGISGISNSGNTVILTGINCNQVSKSSYSQTATMAFTDGYGSYSGCFYAAPTVPATIVSYGQYIGNRI